MNHSIKVNRARKLARFLPRADAEIQASIPEELIESLTAKQLARVRYGGVDYTIAQHQTEDADRGSIRVTE